MTDELIAFLKRQEGLRLSPYLDQVKLPTIGYGHRIPKMATPAITEADAEILLRGDVTRAEEQALRLCPNLHKHPRRLAALTDLCFNVGAGALDGANPNDPMDDSGVVKALRAEDWPLAAVKFRMYCHARTPAGLVIELPELVRRRNLAAVWIVDG